MLAHRSLRPQLLEGRAETDEPQTYFDRLVDALNGLFVHRAEAFDQPNSVHRADLVEQRYRGNGETGVLARGQQDVYWIERKPNG
jgi:hypothetical protein